MDEQHLTPENDRPDPLEQFLSDMLGPEGAREAARAMRSQGFDISQIPGMDNPQAMSMAMNQFKFMMQSSTEPVNWRMVEEMSRAQTKRSGDKHVTHPEKTKATLALSTADLWLDPVTAFVLSGAQREAWDRATWISETLPAWKEISNPVAENASRAMEEALGEELSAHATGLPPELAGLASALPSVLPKLASMALAAQIGQALSAMAEESLGAHDAGFPLTQSSVTALVPANIAKFGEGLNIPEEEVAQYLAVRECAHARLFAAVPWLRHNLHVALQRYAEQIAIDPEAIASAAHSIDPSNPESITQAMENGVFASKPSKDQAASLERLETLLALIEGWVEVVTTEATRAYLPNAASLQEMVRRRRVTGSPAEALLTQLVGLELRPREARNAAQIFKKLQDSGGAEARDGAWSHPDKVPTTAHLADPESFFADEVEQSDTEFEDQLEALLSGTLGWDEGVPEDQRGGQEEDDS